MGDALTLPFATHSFTFFRNPPLVQNAAKVCLDGGFSMRATARVLGEGLTLARVDKPLKEEAVGC
jgi:hypothetical protein